MRLAELGLILTDSALTMRTCQHSRVPAKYHTVYSLLQNTFPTLRVWRIDLLISNSGMQCRLSMSTDYYAGMLHNMFKCGAFRTLASPSDQERRSTAYQGESIYLNEISRLLWAYLEDQLQIDPGNSERLRSSTVRHLRPTFYDRDLAVWGSFYYLSIAAEPETRRTITCVDAIIVAVTVLPATPRRMALISFVHWWDHGLEMINLERSFLGIVISFPIPD